LAAAGALARKHYLFSLALRLCVATLTNDKSIGYAITTKIEPRISDTDPVYFHCPTRKSIGYFGAVRLRDGKFVYQQATGKFNAESFRIL